MKHVPTCKSEGRPSALLLHRSCPDGDVDDQRLDGRKQLPDGWLTTTYDGGEWRTSSYLVDAGGRRCYGQTWGFEVKM